MSFSNVRSELDVSSIQYIEYSVRYYGQPKLPKPQELKNINSIGSVPFIPKHCSPQIYIKDNDIWIKHTDYFSRSWQPPDNDIGRSLDYYANKYFGYNRKAKFTYSDCWGEIILRNEAWLRITNIINLIEKANYNAYKVEFKMAHEILNKQMSYLGFEDYDCTWENYWENVMRFMNKYWYEHKDDVEQVKLL